MKSLVNGVPFYIVDLLITAHSFSLLALPLLIHLRGRVSYMHMMLQSANNLPKLGCCPPPVILALFAGAIETFQVNDQVHLVMKLCTGGDLRTRAPYSEKPVADIIAKVKKISPQLMRCYS